MWYMMEGIRVNADMNLEIVRRLGDLSTDSLLNGSSNRDMRARPQDNL